jgi:hypothetical protein
MTRALHPVAAQARPRCEISPELADELGRAAKDFDGGDYLTLTAEQLARSVVTGASPWTPEFRG